MGAERMLLIRGLRIVFPTRSTEVAAVDRVDMELDDREILGVVGESGSGKSSLCLSLLRLLPLPGIVTHGEMMFQGRDLLRLGEDQMRQLRGASIAMVFQNPMSSLNPYLPVGEQIAEVARLHLGFSRARAKGYAVQMLERVGVSSPESRSAQYPHQLSGGMRQRVMIAIAIAGKPRLLIADEPTASLDVTIQAQILNLLRALVHEEGLSMILVSHDLAVVAGVADRVAVMYRGRVVESASAGQIFSQPRHPYTRALIR